MTFLEQLRKLSMSGRLPNLHLIFAIYAKKLCGSLETLPWEKKIDSPSAKKAQFSRKNQNPCHVEVYLENGSLEANRIDSEEFSRTQ